ncbi:MAG: HemK2/MTQ2 family protein methyltransferase [archaeon]|nr:methyltransferase [Nanoarchaeota archaeon]
MDIYEPAEDSYLLQKQVKQYAFGKVLDLGTGSGIQAKTVAESPKVKNILAVDINKDAINRLQQEIKQNNLKKITAKTSNLFENVEEKFDTIIFNPPYLPQDKVGDTIIEDPALYGGKKGYELIEKFLTEVGEHLTQNGIILLLFSSLTNKDKVDEFISKNLFQAELLITEKLPLFETLYIYKIEQMPIRKKLVSLNVKDLQYLAKGQRGLVYKGLWNRNSLVKTHFAKEKEVTVAVKIDNPKTVAMERLNNESKWLKIVNKKGIGPKLYLSKPEFLILEFIEGIPLPKFIEKDGMDKKGKTEKGQKLIKKVLARILEQAYILDQLKVNKEEMHRPSKNVLVTKDQRVILLDFERCHNAESPQNVTQFLSFLGRHGYVEQDTAMELARKYKETYSEGWFEEIVKSVQSLLK